MKNSICLPLPTSEDSPAIKARCFVVFEDHDRELPAYPFTCRVTRMLNASRSFETMAGWQTSEWCSTLFFPEMWPPGLVRRYLNEFRASVDSGIHLPIASQIDDVRPMTRCFTYSSGLWSELAGEPSTAFNIFMMMEDTKEFNQRFGEPDEWCMVMWFPGNWQPSEIDEYLRSPQWQDSLFLF